MTSRIGALSACVLLAAVLATPSMSEAAPALHGMSRAVQAAARYGATPLGFTDSGEPVGAITLGPETD